MQPSARCVDYRWPSSLWRQSFDGFSEGDHTVLLRSEGLRSGGEH
jgi:hypothetical protein